MGFISYAQNGEDALLNRIFGGQQTGFYVDVGAYHPVVGSVTKAFYDRGWSGINVEPGTIFEKLAADRPRDVNLRMAVLDKQGEIAFFEDAADGGMSHVVAGKTDGQITVPCETLEEIVRLHGRNRPVDFIKIDAEGAEEAIIASTDWRTLRPRVLLIEATLPWSSALSNEKWEPVLIAHGYVRAYFDGINCFYVTEEEESQLFRYFSTPLNVLDNVMRYDVMARSEAEVMRRELETQLAAKSEQSHRQAIELDVARRELAEKMKIHAALIQEHDKSAQTCAVLSAEIESLKAHRAALAQEKEQLSASEASLAAELHRLKSLPETAPKKQNGSPAFMPSSDLGYHGQSWSYKLKRRLGMGAYRIVRPIVRPLAWRIRGFMTSEVVARLDRMQGAPLPVHASYSQHIPNEHGAEIGGLAEMRRLATEMETMLLSLAMESSGPARTVQQNEPELEDSKESSHHSASIDAAS